MLGDDIIQQQYFVELELGQLNDQQIVVRVSLATS